MFGFWRKASTAPVAAPTAADWRARGNAALGAGKLREAGDCYRQATAADPADAAGWLNLGYVLLEQGQARDAAVALERATSLAATQVDVQADAGYLLGRARLLQGDTRGATEALRRGVAARPAFVEALQELVPLLIASGQAAEAVACTQAAAASGNPQGLMLLSQSLHAAGRAAEALAPLAAVLAAHPGDAGALACRGNVLLELRRPAEALADFEGALQAHGRAPDALANASAALLALDRPADALELADEALRADPRHRAALHNKACALKDQGRVAEALAQAQQASHLHPGDPDLAWVLAVSHLLQGDLARGWQAHEARWQAKGFLAAAGRPATTQPQWTGEQPLAGRTILLYAEQGLGDTIQFLRYVPLVAQRAGTVLLHIQPAVVPVLGPLPANCRVLQAGEALPGHDLQCPLLSLPHAFRTTLADVPAAVPYLHADPARVEAWRDRLPAGDKPRVGIVWSGNPGHGNDRHRSIALSTFRAIDPGQVQFVALQPQVRERDQAALAQWSGLFDAGPQLRDFGDTAALLEALDLVVTVDTSVAHIAGALGRPVWILLPHVPDWRWMLERDDSRWYPTARLFRQPAVGDWASVVAQVRSELGRLAAP